MADFSACLKCSLDGDAAGGGGAFVLRLVHEHDQFGQELALVRA